MRYVLIIALSLLTGCASVKPSVKCSLDGKAEVFQGFMGLGVSQALPEVDSRCAALLNK